MTSDLSVTNGLDALLRKHRGALAWSPGEVIGEWSRLPPIDDLVALRDGLNVALCGMGGAKAVELTRLLLGCYPVVKPHDPDTYVRALASVFEGLPADLGPMVVRAVSTAKDLLPTRAVVAATCEEAVKPRQDAKRAVLAYLEEYERRRTTKLTVQRATREHVEKVMKEAGYK